MGAGTGDAPPGWRLPTGHVIVLKYTCCQKQGVVVKGNDAEDSSFPAQAELFPHARHKQHGRLRSALMEA
jgi:hypothetical protein